PLMSIPALIGALWAFDRAARPSPDRAALFVLAAFLIPTLLNGLFETRYQNFRYNVPFGALYFTFVALGVVKWRALASAWRGEPHDAGGRAPRRSLTPAAVTALLVAAVFAYDMNPLRGWLVAQRAYSNEGRLYSFFDLRGFR